LRKTKRFNKRDIREDEIFRAQVRQIIDIPVDSSTLGKLSKNPLVSIILSFLLMGVAGASLTYYFNGKLKNLEIDRNTKQRQFELERDERLKELTDQKTEYQRNLDRERAERKEEVEYQRNIQRRELEREHSFSDELSKTRVAKIAEVWEKVSLYETATEERIKSYDRLRRTVTGMFMKEDEKAKEESNLLEQWRHSYKESTEVLTKNRFWLGEDNYQQISTYLETTQTYLITLKDYSFCRLRGKYSCENLKELEGGLKEYAQRREHLRQNIIQIKNNLLKV
jgi:TolA-binding protein